MKTEQYGQGLFRLNIPFEDLTTSVYIVVAPSGAAIIDSATYPTDVDAWILPALQEIGVERQAVKRLLLTHDHGDHAGGLPRLIECFPDAVVRTSYPTPLSASAPLRDGERILERLQTVALPGHTKTSVAYLDLPTKTLLSGDCLQLKGIGIYRNNVAEPWLYRASIQRLMTMDLERIIAAHEFDPLGSVAEGKQAVTAYLEECLRTAPAI